MSLLRVSKGMGLLEVIIAMFLTTVAIMATMSLQAPSLRTAARSDYFGRAAEILEWQMESTEAYLMNANNTLANAGTGIPLLPTVVNANASATYPVKTSGLAVAAPIINGDTIYTVTTTITGVYLNPVNGFMNTYRVDVQVSWPPLNPTGISQTIFVSRQDTWLM
jgi:Tfp pilus assembly protein PilV